MAKYHMNPVTGVVNRCHAEKQPCAFGPQDHFETIDAARKAFESRHKKDMFIPLSKKEDIAARTEMEQKFDNISEKLGELSAQRKDLLNHNKIREREDPNYRLGREWFDTVQEAKNLRYRMSALAKERENYMTQDQLEEEREKSKLKERAKKTHDASFYHPEVLDDSMRRDISEVVTSFSGMSKEEFSQKVSELQASGLSDIDAARKMFAETPMRTDKPIVAIDLETAAPSFAGIVDRGPSSSIIEVGYVKMYPNGDVEKKSYLCGVPDDLAATDGTGAEDIHHISLDMVDGKIPFVDDREKQRELYKDLHGSVLLAHNADFEKGQLSHNLRGFNQLVANGDVEILDTMNVNKYFNPETEDNTNKSFVESTGGTYEDAHRAFEDAMMSLNALLRLKGMKEVD